MMLQRSANLYALLRKYRKLSKIATTLTISSFTAVHFLPKNDFDVLARVGAGMRFIRSVKIGLVISLDYTISMSGLNENSPNYDVMMSFIHKRAAERILDGCLINGGTYIKLGQGLVSLSHILPAEYIEVLCRLQDKCLTRKNDEVEQLFRQDFSASPHELFLCFEPEPIAAASLAQVFKARTKDNQCVAVKVQYIDLKTRFVSDVTTINFLLKVVSFMHPSFDFSWVLDDLVDNLKEELDFLNEAKNAEKCEKDLKHLSYVYVPKIFWNLSNDRVLVTEFIDGFKVNDIENLKKNNFKFDDIDRKLFNAFGEQIFQTGFVHADPHPGNILVRKMNNETQLVLLDHGLYQKVSYDERIALNRFWKALVLADHKKMQKYARHLGVDDYSMLAEILTQRPLKSQNFKLVSKLSDEEMRYMTEFAQKRFDVIMKTLRTMPRSLLLVVRNLNTIRSIAHDHGDPIDRYTTLARVATKSAESNKSSSIISMCNSFYTTLIFEYQLLKSRMWLWFVHKYFAFLHLLGRSPNANELLSQMR